VHKTEIALRCLQRMFTDNTIHISMVLVCLWDQPSQTHSAFQIYG